MFLLYFFLEKLVKAFCPKTNKQHEASENSKLASSYICIWNFVVDMAAIESEDKKFTQVHVVSFYVLPLRKFVQFHHFSLFYSVRVRVRVRVWVRVGFPLVMLQCHVLSI